ncbi:hypothetical protein RHGRI_030013 [Rhododendron griersonianum]|uniref:Uncharacterized protein n=1 Tax=Rhododendron griersonianum TaxID=479676 RepID=A0AAV6ILA3_9ERIC|nr:hypothetical protein RHGRI_030013 [Rhododendron griersonianum]
MEALAMVGVDYLDWGMDMEEWERGDSELPPLLLAEAEEEEENEKDEVGVQEQKRETICGYPVTFQVKGFEKMVPSSGRGV